jgi:hypothetical protein
MKALQLSSLKTARSRAVSLTRCTTRHLKMLPLFRLVLLSSRLQHDVQKSDQHTRTTKSAVMFDFQGCMNFDSRAIGNAFGSINGVVADAGSR